MLNSEHAFSTWSESTRPDTGSLHQMTLDEAYSTLAAKTGMTASDWKDFLSCDEGQQMLLAQTYADMDWVKSASTFQEVLGILQVIGTIAGVVSGVAGAATAIAALSAL